MHAQFLWIVQTPKFTNHLYSAQCLLASEQSSIMQNMSHNLHWNHLSSISLLLPISLKQRWTTPNSLTQWWFTHFFFNKQTQIFHLQILCLLPARSSLTFRQLECGFTLKCIRNMTRKYSQSPHLVGWVCLSFQYQFVHQGNMKIQQYFLIGNFKSTLP